MAVVEIVGGALGKGKPEGPQTPGESAHSDAGPYIKDCSFEDAICGGEDSVPWAPGRSEVFDSR